MKTLDSYVQIFYFLGCPGNQFLGTDGMCTETCPATQFESMNLACVENCPGLPDHKTPQICPVNPASCNTSMGLELKVQLVK